MITDVDGARSLFLALDDPDHLETPADFDFESEAERFDAFVQTLQTAFPGDLVLNEGWDDGAVYAEIRISPEVTATGEYLTIRVSTFGLVTVYLTFEFARDYREPEVFTDPADEALIDKAASAHGYVFVPMRLLYLDYDGPVTSIRLGSWQMRYFEIFDYSQVWHP